VPDNYTYYIHVPYLIIIIIIYYMFFCECVLLYNYYLFIILILKCIWLFICILLAHFPKLHPYKFGCILVRGTQCKALNEWVKEWKLSNNFDFNGNHWGQSDPTNEYPLSSKKCWHVGSRWICTANFSDVSWTCELLNMTGALHLGYELMID